MADNKKVLFIDNEGIIADKKTKKEVLDACFELASMTKAVGVKIDDYREYLKDPIEYTQTEYFEANKHLLPNAIAPGRALYLTNWDGVRASILWELISSNINKVKINKIQIEENTNKDLYTYYLDNNKTEHYEAIQRYLESLKGLEKFGTVRTNHAGLVAEGLKFNLQEVYTDYSYFRG